MFLATRIGRIAVFLAAQALFLLSACAGPQQQNADRPTVGELSGRDRLLAMCEGENPYAWGSFGGSGTDICRSLVLGIVEAAAATGRSQPDSKFCVARGFNPDAYEEKFLRALRERDLPEAAQGELVFGDLMTEDRSSADCYWPGQLSLQQLGDDCRWLLIGKAKDRESYVRDLILRSGARSRGAAKRVAARSISRCSGYFIGFLAAPLLAKEAKSSTSYCPVSMHGGSASNDLSPESLEGLAENLVEILESSPEKAQQPVGLEVHDLLVERLPCNLGPSTSASSAEQAASLAEKREAKERAHRFQDLAASAAYQSATKWAACEPSAVN